MTCSEIRGARIALDLTMREGSLAKRIPGAKYGRDGVWTIPLSWGACKALRGVFGERMEIGPTLAEWAWGEFERVQEILAARERALNPDLDCDGDPRLRPYQRTAVEYLRLAGSALLADDMGTGKSVMSLRAVEKWPLLVVAGKTMSRKWVREIKTWTGREAILLEGSAVARRKMLEEDAEAYVVSWSVLWRHSRLAPYGSIRLSETEKTPGPLNGRFRTVIADETHRAKDPKAKQTRALWAVGDEAEHRLALTGTPMEKHEAEFWSMLRFISPRDWPSRSAFLDRYCTVSYDTWGGMEIVGLRSSTEAEFREIVAPSFLRRTKALVLPMLPEKVYVRRDVEMTSVQRKAYRQMADGLVAELETGTLMAFDPLVQGARLSQLASASVEMTASGPRMCEPSSKLDALEDILDEMDGGPLAVFAASRQLLDLAYARLQKRGVTVSRVVGGMTASASDDAAEQYNSGAARVILISLGAGAEGLSLSRGSTALFLDRSWSQTQNKQGEDRLHGIGRGDADAKSLVILDLVTTGTVEEHRADYLAGKSDRFEDLFRDRDLLLASLRHGGK